MADLAWHEVEILEVPELSAEQFSRVERHSLLNTLNVLQLELAVLGSLVADNEELFSHSLQHCLDLLAKLDDPRLGKTSLTLVETCLTHIFNEIETVLHHYSPDRRGPGVADCIANVFSVFESLRRVGAELQARAGFVAPWATYSLSGLHRDCCQLLETMASTSRGRYGVVFNPALKLDTDYYADLRFEGKGDLLRLPLSFPDVLRDLVANARKYTPVGGTITVGLCVTEHTTHILVKDNGRGIPPDELVAVTGFGYRGRNANDVRSFGGGVGLTKAVYVTKSAGGRFWLASELGRGTRVRIELQLPASAMLHP